MAIFTINFRLYGAADALADADALPTIEVTNPTTAETIVAAGSAMTQAAGDTGHYTYALTYGGAEAADTIIENQTYEYTVSYVYNTGNFTVDDMFASGTATAGESTLTATYNDLMTAIQDAYKDFTDAALLARMIKEAYLMFLYPPDVLGKGSHVWSFLSPSATLTLEANDYDYDLPATFGGIVGNQIVLQSTTDYYDPVRIVTPEQIHRMRLGVSTTSVPNYAAVQPKPFVAGTGSRWELIVYPTPDATYTAGYRFNVNPDAVVAGEYPIGGPQHALTIRAACRAKAEQKRSGGARGHYYLEFVDCLRASIQQDEIYMGYNTPEVVW